VNAADEKVMVQAAIEKYREDHGRDPSPEDEAMLRYFCRFIFNSLVEDDE
jgi:hypothetical protein